MINKLLKGVPVVTSTTQISYQLAFFSLFAIVYDQYLLKYLSIIINIIYVFFADHTTDLYQTQLVSIFHHRSFSDRERNDLTLRRTTH